MRYVDLPHGNAALAIFPSARGFGWALFDGPLSLVRWGVSTVAKRPKGNARKNERCLNQIEKMITKWRPAMMVLEKFEGGDTRRYKRVKDLHRSIISQVTMSGVPVSIVSRQQIAACFASQRATTRYEVATVVASFLKEIAIKLPDPRKSWETDDPAMALFSAAALGIVHYANPAQPL